MRGFMAKIGAFGYLPSTTHLNTLLPTDLVLPEQLHCVRELHSALNDDVEGEMTLDDALEVIGTLWG